MCEVLKDWFSAHKCESGGAHSLSGVISMGPIWYLVETG